MPGTVIDAKDIAVEQNRHKSLPSSGLLQSRGVDSKEINS